MHADDQRLNQHITSEVMQITQGLMLTIRDTFGPELIEHLTGAFIVARKIARERNGKADIGLPPQDNVEELHSEE